MDQEDLYYKYLHQDICPYRQSGWLLKIPGDVVDWNSAIITGKGVEFNPYKERLLVVEKISTLQSYGRLIEHLRNQMELEELSKELNNRLDIKQLVIDINRELRKLIVDHRQMFYSNGQFSHCSVQVSPHSDKVRGTKYYMIHVVFHIQRKGYQHETFQWWISCCNLQTIAAGRRTMRRDCDVIIQECDNWVTSKKQHWRTTDEKGHDLVTSAESNIPSNADNILKVPTPQEITRLDTRCEKVMMNEVKFFIHSYEEFMTCENEKLQSVIHALNAANVERYNEVRIQDPGFIWDPPRIDINKLVMLVQKVYPAQVVEYSLGHGKKLSLETEDNDKHKVEETAGLFPPSKPKANNNKYNDSFRDFNEEQSINEVNDGDRG